MKHVYNESANFNEKCFVYFDMNGLSHLTEIVPVIGMEGDVSRARFCYTLTKGEMETV